MRISFHGAARTVTGSQHLIQVNGFNLLLECGLFQGAWQEAYERNRRFAFDPAEIDAVILTHAHLDHSGNLPNLVKRGFRGPVYATPVTVHLTNLMLLDASQIHNADIEYVNERRSRQGEDPLQPIYTEEDVRQVAGRFQAVDYAETFQVFPGVCAQLLDAGHILGSAAVALDVEENGKTSRLWFSGDIGRRDIPLVRDPVLPSEAHALVMECTYGDKNHTSPFEAVDELREVVTRTIQREGKVIVPAFAVGRTQELVYNLHQLIDRREIPLVPIYIDSPLAVSVSQVFEDHPEFFDQETHDFMAGDTSRSPIDFEMVTYVQSAEQSLSLDKVDQPMVIVSTSGMAEAGRILHHLRRHIEDPRHTVLLVSWQAPGTLGRQLADGAKEVKIFEETYEVKAEVVSIPGLSAHAGRDMLLEYAAATKESVKSIFLVHGEPGPAEALRQGLAGLGLRDVYYPDLDEGFELRR